MINPREFCRQSTYETALIFTYAFDPLFFERMVLPDLVYGGTSKVIVIADLGQLEAILPRCTGQVRQLGRRYFLCPFAGDKRFHPKMILKIGVNEGLVWVGSGNVTAGGWGGNRELAQSWPIGPEHDDRGEWIAAVIERAVDWVSSDVNKTEVRNVLKGTWLRTQRAPEDLVAAPVLLGDGDLVLSAQLAERWANRKFDQVLVMTGSTDEDGAFLRWAHDAFGIKRAHVLLNPSRATFNPERINALPIETTIIPAPDGQMMHAKFYWFEGKDDAAAIFGSANCSHAAWLPVATKAGNVEMMVPYDRPVRDEFKDILAMFENAETFLPQDVLTRKEAPEDDGESEIQYRITALEMEPTPGRVAATFKPTPPDSAEISLSLSSGERVATIDLERRGDSWVGTLRDMEGLSGVSLLARAMIVTTDDPFETPARWVDNIEELRQSSRARNAGTAVGNLSGSGKSSHEQRQILSDIQSAASLILRDTDSFADPFIKRKTRSRDKDSDTADFGQAAAVDPNALVKSVNELRQQNPTHRMREGGHVHGLSLGGILGSFFDFKSLDSHDDEVAAASEPEKELAGQVRHNPSANPNSDPPPGSSEMLPDGSRERLKSILEDFLSKLSERRFADRCSAMQLTEAAAFPIAVCVKGARGGWMTPGRLGKVASRVCEILFHNRYEKGVLVGLLAFVRARYAKEETEEVFDQILGDGRLWAVLIAALGATEWPGPVGAIRKAEVLTDAFNNETLLIAVDADRLVAIIDGLGIEEAERSILDNSGEAVGALAALKEYLLAHWGAIYEDQGNGRRLHNSHNFMWNPKWGWELIEGGTTYMPDYLNLDWAIHDDPQVKSLVDDLAKTLGR